MWVGRWCAFAGAILAGLLARGDAAMAEAPVHRVVTLSSLCLLDGKEFATRDHVLAQTRAACRRGKPDLVVTPFLPFLSFREGHGLEDLAPFVVLAKEHRTYLLVAMPEVREGGGRSNTAVLLGRDGKVAGRYRQAHAFLDDDGLLLGDDLPVFRTDFATLGLSVGSDFHFPEVYWVQRMKGAEVLVWQTAPERLRQYHDYLPLLKARALDNHAHLITAMYADPRAYLTNRHAMGMPGAAWGRSMVINRVGAPVADTGYANGVATAVVDLDRRKRNVHEPFYQAEDVFFVNCLGDRAAFGPVAEAYTLPQRPAYRKRAARIAVGYFDPAEMWVNGKVPETMLRVIDQAAELKPDLLLLSEMGAKVTDETTRQVMAMVSERARKMGCYIAIGGLGDAEQISIARVWDREGKEIFQQPLYWPKGFPEVRVFDTDFARIGVHSCGDLYTGEFDRVLALKGAEIILDPSQMWGADGENNELMLRARAAENGVWLACAHWNTSDPGLRSVVVDPYGQVMASSRFQENGVFVTDVDFDRPKVYYAGRKEGAPAPGATGIPSYYTGDLPEQRPGWREMVFARRRPELYGIMPTVNDVVRKYRPAKSPW